MNNTIDLFRIIDVSRHTGTFGHTDHIMVNHEGDVWKAPRIRSSYPGEWNKGDVVKVPVTNGHPDFYKLGVEAPHKIDRNTDRFPTPQSLAEYVWADDFLAKEQALVDEAKAKRAKFLSNNRPTKRDREAIKQMGPNWGKEKDRPAEYAIPLRRRDRIIDWLKGQHGWQRVGGRSCNNYNNSGWYFGFDVKLYGLKLDFDTLKDVYLKSQHEPEQHPLSNDPEYIEACRAKYDEEIGEDGNSLYEEAVEDASRGITEHDTFRTLFDGTEVDAELGFMGRSGGIVVLMRFEGHKLNHDFDFDDLSDVEVFKLYELVTLLAAGLNREKAVAEVQYQAAWRFFECTCEDVPLPGSEIGAGI